MTSAAELWKEGFAAPAASSEVTQSGGPSRPTARTVRVTQAACSCVGAAWGLQVAAPADGSTWHLYERPRQNYRLTLPQAQLQKRSLPRMLHVMSGWLATQ